MTVAAANLQIASENTPKEQKYIYLEKKPNFKKVDFKKYHNYPAAGMIMNFVLAKGRKDPKFLFDVKKYAAYSGVCSRTINRNITILVRLNQCIMVKNICAETEYYFSKYPFTKEEKYQILHQQACDIITENDEIEVQNVARHGCRADKNSNLQVTDNITSLSCDTGDLHTPFINNKTSKTNTTLHSNYSITQNVPSPPVQANVPETKSDSSTSDVSPNDVVVENQIKKQKENSEIVDYEAQLAAVESHKTLPGPVKQDSKPKSKAKQIFEQVPESYMAELTDDQKHEIWGVIGKDRDRWPNISVGEMAQRLIQAVVSSKAKYGCIKNIAGWFFKSLEKRYPIEKQDTQADLVARRVPAYKPRKQLTEEERRETKEYMEKVNLSQMLRLKMDKNFKVTADMADRTIELDIPINDRDFAQWKVKFGQNHPLRKAFVTAKGMQIICASEDDRDKIIAYLLPEVIG